MMGGIINTYSALAYAETTFGLQRSERIVGPVGELNRRSAANREAIDKWVSKSKLIELGVADAERRGAAVTLLRVSDPDITDPGIHADIIAKSKQLLGYEGLTHPNGDHEPGLDVARYVNAFPGTPGDYRAWIGGIRPVGDVTALLDNLEYAYHRAKVVKLEELLDEYGVSFERTRAEEALTRKDDPDRAYKVLIADLVGLRFDADGNPDHSAVKAYVEAKGGVFHEGPLDPKADLKTGRIHFFYQPDLSTADELLPITEKGQYDAVIAAATFLPEGCVFKEGGVRIGAGTGNMGSKSWGGGNGDGGAAPLMNTPSFNSRATAQMAIKALLKVLPDLPVDELHERVVERNFDTGKNLREYPTEKLEGKRMAVLGFGNIGREVATLARAFGMKVTIHARGQHQEWIEAEGFAYAPTAEDAARGADVISPHTGLGALDPDTGRFANAGFIDEVVLSALNDGAVVVNYDRGEVIDADALDRALGARQGALRGDRCGYLHRCRRQCHRPDGALPRTREEAPRQARTAAARGRRHGAPEPGRGREAGGGPDLRGDPAQTRDQPEGRPAEGLCQRRRADGGRRRQGDAGAAGRGGGRHGGACRGARHGGADRRHLGCPLRDPGAGATQGAARAVRRRPRQGIQPLRDHDAGTRAQRPVRRIRPVDRQLYHG